MAKVTHLPPIPESVPFPPVSIYTEREKTGPRNSRNGTKREKRDAERIALRGGHGTEIESEGKGRLARDGAGNAPTDGQCRTCPPDVRRRRGFGKADILLTPVAGGERSPRIVELVREALDGAKPEQVAAAIGPIPRGGNA